MNPKAEKLGIVIGGCLAIAAMYTIAALAIWILWFFFAHTIFNLPYLEYWKCLVGAWTLAVLVNFVNNIVKKSNKS